MGESIFDPMAQKYFIKQSFTLVPGLYDLKTLVDTFQNKIRSVGMGLEFTTVTYNEDRHRIVIDQNARKAIITCFSNI